MSDHELLKLAAKASGIDVISSGGQLWSTMDGSIHKWTERWNPLAIDGQALRLAVKLHIDFKAYEQSVRALAIDTPKQRIVASIEEPIGTDPYAATRLAIVRAAAEIGKAMP